MTTKLPSIKSCILEAKKDLLNDPKRYYFYSSTIPQTPEDKACILGFIGVQLIKAGHFNINDPVSLKMIAQLLGYESDEHFYVTHINEKVPRKLSDVNKKNNDPQTSIVTRIIDEVVKKFK